MAPRFRHHFGLHGSDTALRNAHTNIVERRHSSGSHISLPPGLIHWSEFWSKAAKTLVSMTILGRSRRARVDGEQGGSDALSQLADSSNTRDDESQSQQTDSASLHVPRWQLSRAAAGRRVHPPGRPRATTCSTRATSTPRTSPGCQPTRTRAARRSWVARCRSKGSTGSLGRWRSAGRVRDDRLHPRARVHPAAAVLSGVHRPDQG